MARRRAPDLPERAFAFGVRATRCCCRLWKSRAVPWGLIDQILDATSSIGANIEEGQAGSSHRDFLSKYQIALREARESHFRLRVLSESDVVPDEEKDELEWLVDESKQLKLILGKCVVTAKLRSADRTSPRRPEALAPR